MQSVTVTVGANNAITCAPDPVPMAGQGRNAVIQWSISTSGWSFAPNGIAFDANDQFTQLRPIGNNRFQCVDANSDSNFYKYTVNLVNSNGTPASVDPGIQNGS
jgi:hypothetical protein